MNDVDDFDKYIITILKLLIHEKDLGNENLENSLNENYMKMKEYKLYKS